MYPTFVFGFDGGNTDTCGCLIDRQGNTRTKVMSSMLAFGSVANLANKRSGLGDNYEHPTDALRSGELVIEYQGSEYFIGDLALQQSLNANTGYGDVNRYASTRALLLLLAVSAEMVGSSEYGLEVVTGLPIKTYSKDNRKAVKQALEGTHVFTLNGKWHKAHINVQRVIMEGAGALIQYGDNKSPLQGVIDIGGRTTDLYVAQGQEPYIDLCDGQAIGVENVGTQLNARMRKFGRELSASEIKKCLRAYLGENEYPSANAKGQTIEPEQFKEWTDRAISEVANEVTSYVGKVWNSSEQGDVASQIKPVVLVGGGAYYFHRIIEKRVKHAIMPMKPERANAEGYAALANVLVARNLMTA